MSNTKQLRTITVENKNVYTKVHHSNKAIRFGDHSPEKPHHIWWVEKQSTKGWREPRDRKIQRGRERERYREIEREQSSFPKKERNKNQHETLCQALKLCVTK